MAISSARTRVAVGAGLGAGAAFALTPGVAHALDYPVTSLADTETAGTLRTAIDDANMNSGPDSITFSTSLSGTITLLDDLPYIEGPTTITGPPSGAVSIAADSPSEPNALVFAAAADPSTVTDLTLTGTPLHGVFSYSNLTLEDVSIDGATEVGVVGDETTGQDEITLKNAEITGNDTGLTMQDGMSLSVESGSQVDSNEAGIGMAGGGVLNLADSSVSGNTPSGGISINAGGINMNRSTVSGNTRTGSSGGGIRQDHGYATIYDSTIADNSATNGGGIWATYSYTLLQQTTVSGNTASGNGGGIAAPFVYDLTAYTSTFSDNTATTGFGGAVALAETQELDLYNSTVAGNNAPPGKGGGIANYQSDSSVDMISTVVADSTGGDLFGSGITWSVSSSLIEDTALSFGPSNQTGVDPQLGPLADNGGPTLTRKPAPTSPVLDKGVSVTIDEDQRGFPMPVDLPLATNGTQPGGGDIGAVELTLAEGPQPPATPQPPAQPAKKCKGKKKKKKKCKKKRKKK